MRDVQDIAAHMQSQHHNLIALLQTPVQRVKKPQQFPGVDIDRVHFVHRSGSSLRAASKATSASSRISCASQASQSQSAACALNKKSSSGSMGRIFFQTP
jgi:hypothetical protein